MWDDLASMEFVYKDSPACTWSPVDVVVHDTGVREGQLEPVKSGTPGSRRIMAAMKCDAETHYKHVLSCL